MSSSIGHDTLLTQLGALISIRQLPIMGKKETLNFRVQPEFKKRMVEEAKKQRRSLTNYLETTFLEVWKNQGLVSRKKE